MHISKERIEVLKQFILTSDKDITTVWDIYLDVIGELEYKQKYLQEWVNSGNEVKALKDKLSEQNTQITELEADIEDCRDKLHRRNLQIAELKELQEKLKTEEEATIFYQKLANELKVRLIEEREKAARTNSIDFSEKLHRRNLQIVDLKQKTAKESLLFVNTIIDNFNMVDLNNRNTHDVLNELKARINR